jgi:hypothetical protein
MNHHYLLVLAAFLLAQLLMTSIMVYNYQKEKSIKYWNALGTYMNAEVGYFVVGFFAIFSFLFILSDFIDLSVTKEELQSITDRNWKQNLQLYFKTGAFLISCFIQYIAFTVRKKGKAAIDKIADKI